MKDIAAFIAIGIGVFGYFIRLEVNLARIQTDLKWIKERLSQCQQL